MAIHSVFVVLLVLAGARFACSGAAASPGFDLFVFVRSYSPTFCHETACSIRPISAFTIHGLWPEYNTGGWPEFCGGNKSSTGSSGRTLGSADGGRSDSRGGTRRLKARHLPPASLAPSRGSLNAQLSLHSRHKSSMHGSSSDEGSSGGSSGGSGLAGTLLQPHLGSEPEPQPASEQQKCEWPSFKGPDAGFWDHEWARHGTCARPLIGDRSAFFQAVMRLHEQYNLDIALAQAGIQPSNISSYRTTKLVRAVEDAFGVRPLVSCFHGQLLELWLCVGLDLKVRQCPAGVRKAFRPTCSKTIALPLGSPVPQECKSFFPPWRAPQGGGQDTVFVRIATALAVAGAGAAAVTLFWSGVRARRRASLLAAIPEERYDPLQSWP